MGRRRREAGRPTRVVGPSADLVEWLDGLWRELDGLGQVIREAESELPPPPPGVANRGTDVVGKVILRVLEARGLSPETAEGTAVALQAAMTTRARLAVQGWRKTRGLYRFDAALWRELQNSTIQRLALDSLMHLPEPVVLVEVPHQDRRGLAERITGKGWTLESIRALIISLDHSSTPGAVPWTLSLVVVGEVDDPRVPFGMTSTLIPLEDDLADCVPPPELLDGMLSGEVATYDSDVLADLREKGAVTVEIQRARAQAALAPLLWLAQAIDHQDRAAGERVQREIKGRGRRTVGKPLATTWEIGARLGPVLRQADDAERTEGAAGGGDGRTVRPHLRRGHWRGVWVGPRDGERRIEPRWIAPTVVNAEQIEGGRSMPAVIRDVE